MTTAPEAELTLDYLPVIDLPDNELNVKEHALDEIRASILRWGVSIPLLVDERTGKLVAGHGRKQVLHDLEAEADEGEAPPRFCRVGEHGEWLIPVTRGWRSDSDDEAEAHAMSLNYTQELGGWKATPLAERLRELHKRDRGLTAAAGFRDSDVRARVSKLNVLPPRDTETRREAVKYRCPRCRHEGPPADFRPQQEDPDGR